MKYTVYRTTNLVNEKIYVGVHKTANPNDAYIGSGKILKQAIRVHGRKNFKKEVLFTFDTLEEAYSKEKEIVDKAFVDREDTYNLSIGGSVSPTFTDERKRSYSDRMSGHNHPQYGKRQSTESNRKRSETLKGRKMSSEAIEKSVAARRGRPSPFKGKKREYVNSLKGRPQTTESNQKRSEAHLRLEKMRCCYCDKLISPQNHSRWHGRKCKSSPQ